MGPENRGFGEDLKQSLCKKIPGTNVLAYWLEHPRCSKKVLQLAS
jgi:hypothetical protein